MTKPETLFEQASYNLNQFRERRMAERRAIMRDTPDRRRQPGDTIAPYGGKQDGDADQTNGPVDS